MCGEHAGAHEEVAASFIWSTIRRLYATREGEGKTEAFGYISGGYAPVFARAEDYLTARGITVRKSARVERLAAAGVRDLTFLDVLVVHHVNHRGRAKRLADICFVLNVEDAGHAFDNHESEMFWNESAAKAAWAKTMAFLQLYLPA